MLTDKPFETVMLTNLSIKNKLIAIILLSTFAALTIGFSIIIVLNVRSLQHDMVDNTRVIARVVGDYTTSALSFEYRQEAKDNLKSLTDLDEIERAAVYNKNNQLFASCDNPRHPNLQPIAPTLDTTAISLDGTYFKDDKLIVYHCISYNGEFAGTVVLQSTTAFLNVKIRNYLVTMISTGLGLAIISVLLALRLQRVISEPLTQLASLLQRISQENDYSIRFQTGRTDEIGIVADGLNDMVSQIQSRESERNKAQEALARALREDFRETVRNLQNLIYKVTRSGEGKYVFTLFEGKLSGDISAESVLSKTLAEVFGDVYEETFSPYFDRAFQGQPEQFEMMFRRRYYLNVLEPIVENGKVREVVGSAVEITEQKRSENRLRLSEQRYKALVEGLPVGILQSVKRGSLSAAVRLEFVNSEFVRQTGYSIETFSEMAHSDRIVLPMHPDDKVYAEDLWGDWLAAPMRSTLYRSYRLHIRQSEYRWFDEYATKFEAETGEMVIIQAFLDVTDKKIAEEQLQLALKKERELNALKSRFVSTVSHEFRTPLTGILLSVDLLNRYFTKLTERQRNDELDKVRHRVSELTNLMNDFLAQSESQSIAAKFKPVPVDVVAVCKSVIADMESVSHAGNKGSIEYRSNATSAIISGDAKLLTHILRNLISNAIKYSPPSDDSLMTAVSNVVVSLEQHDYGVHIDVTDHGIGIPPDELEYLFTPFFRASNASKISGTGVGLSIVKEFVELHGGLLNVHSIVGIGSTFSIRFPLAADAMTLAAKDPHNGAEQELEQKLAEGYFTGDRGELNIDMLNSNTLKNTALKSKDEPSLHDSTKTK